MVSFYACSDDMQDEEEEMMEEEDNCDGTSFTYTADVKSIVDSNCTLSGCHDGGSSQPDFRSYAGIMPFASSASLRTSSRNMPPASSGRSLTEDQIRIIQCWAENGAPE